MLYRPDRIAPPTDWAVPILPGDLWSDDARHEDYNMMVRAPYPHSHERLRRADPLYDLVILTDWNWPYAVKGRGSAIFLHQQRRKGYPTEGCIAFSRADLLHIARRITFGSRVIVPADSRLTPPQLRDSPVSLHPDPLDAPRDLCGEIRACRLCAHRFALTRTAHAPRPVAWFRPGARLLIAGQAPGLRVHASGRPFDDRSGDRLRDWLGIDRDTFYDRDKVAVVPMAFCFPGYDARGADLPPPELCRDTWHDRVMRHLHDIRLTVVIGAYAQRYHLGSRGSVTQTVAGWRDHLPDRLPLPHPSWRNTGWLKKNPWFETDLVPELRARVATLLEPPDDRADRP